MRKWRHITLTRIHTKKKRKTGKCQSSLSNEFSRFQVICCWFSLSFFFFCAKLEWKKPMEMSCARGFPYSVAHSNAQKKKRTIPLQQILVKLTVNENRYRKKKKYIYIQTTHSRRLSMIFFFFFFCFVLTMRPRRRVSCMYIFLLVFLFMREALCKRISFRSLITYHTKCIKLSTSIPIWNLSILLHFCCCYCWYYVSRSFLLNWWRWWCSFVCWLYVRAKV